MEHWNVYALTESGVTLLATVNGRDARKAAKEFGRDYQETNSVRVWITKKSI